MITYLHNSVCLAKKRICFDTDIFVIFILFIDAVIAIYVNLYCVPALALSQAFRMYIQHNRHYK